jgi:hypothetical protein
MESIIRKVRDIPASQRLALEHVIGQQLRENQQIIIHVVNDDQGTPAAMPHQNGSASTLPAWCNVYEGLSDDEVDQISKSIVRSPGGRAYE